MAAKIHTPPECQAYRKHFSELSHSVRNPEWLASELFSEGLVSFEALDEAVTVVGVSCIQKTRKVLCHFKKKLADHPEAFHQFIAILRKERSLQWLANRVEATYSELRHSCGHSKQFSGAKNHVQSINNHVYTVNNGLLL